MAFVYVSKDMLPNTVLYRCIVYVTSQHGSFRSSPPEVLSLTGHVEVFYCLHHIHLWKECQVQSSEKLF
jgi:hypothetical protein